MVLKISEVLKPEAIIMKIKSREKIAVLKELVSHMVANKFVEDGEKFQKALAKRENLESTGIGDGIAIPHARTDAVKNLVLAFARSEAKLSRLLRKQEVRRLLKDADSPDEILSIIKKNEE
jgi:PTS system fructose-specific IIC component